MTAPAAFAFRSPVCLRCGGTDGGAARSSAQEPPVKVIEEVEKCLKK